MIKRGRDRLSRDVSFRGRPDADSDVGFNIIFRYLETVDLEKLKIVAISLHDLPSLSRVRIVETWSGEIFFILV